MRHLICSDIHGCPEIQDLLDKMAPVDGDKVIFGGDHFDRALGAPVVWDLIRKHNVECFAGNHEIKMMRWLQGRRDGGLPLHYYIAMNLLIEHGVSPAELLAFLEGLSLLREYTTSAGSKFIVAHAAVDPENPLKESESWNVYGNPPQEDKGRYPKKVHFWDIYDGILTIYGHQVSDSLPRIRKNSQGVITSIGIDIGAVHGLGLCGYCPEEDKFYTVKTLDHYTKVQEMIKEKAPEPLPELVAFVNEKRAANAALVQVGDRVTLSEQFLRVARHKDDDPAAPKVVGKVTGITSEGSITLAEIAWHSNAALPLTVNVANLSRVNDRAEKDKR